MWIWSKFLTKFTREYIEGAKMATSSEEKMAYVEATKQSIGDLHAFVTDALKELV